MQLATSQRPHPPPVPPRPSRQVVAEALKRSPRPPCPTRQAPPPPNTKPWRSDDEKDNAKLPKPGRTVVYDSGKEKQTNGEHRKRSNSNERQLARPFVSPRCSNDETVARSSSGNITGNAVPEKTVERAGCDVGGTTRGASERNESENHRERHQQPQHHQQRAQPRENGGERCDRENSTARLCRADSEISETIKDERSSISHNNVAGYEKSLNLASVSNAIDNNRAFEADDETRDDKSKSSIKCSIPLIADRTPTKITRSDDAILRNSERDYEISLNDFAIEKIGKTTTNERTAFRDKDAEKTIGKRNDCSGETTKRLSTTPTNIEKIFNDNGIDKVVDSREENGETISRRGGGEDEEDEEIAAAAYAAMSGSTTTISSDDCATVVVIDEPERKIAFNEDNDNIHHQDWLEAGVRYSSTKITLPGDEPIDRNDEFEYLDDNRRSYDGDDDIRRAYAQLDFSSIRERIAMSSLQGLPPLPRSLSGFNLSEGRREVVEPPPPPARSSSKTPKNIKSTQPSSSRPSPPGRQLTTLDTQLAILRKEMFGLRQLDLSLLSQLWSLNESIQEFRQLLQEQEDRAPSPSPSSEEGDDNSYGSHPPPPPRRPAPLLHHHRPPRPPRPLRPPASDDSPSSEEYGAV